MLAAWLHRQPKVVDHMPSSNNPCAICAQPHPELSPGEICPAIVRTIHEAVLQGKEPPLQEAIKKGEESAKDDGRRTKAATRRGISDYFKWRRNKRIDEFIPEDLDEASEVVEHVQEFAEETTKSVGKILSKAVDWAVDKLGELSQIG